MYSSRSCNPVLCVATDFFARFFRCGRAGFSLLCLGHIVVSLPPVLLRHFFTFIKLLNFVLRVGVCFGAATSFVVSIARLELLPTFGVSCQRSDLSHSLINVSQTVGLSRRHRRLHVIIARSSHVHSQLLFSLYHRSYLLAEPVLQAR